MNPLTSREEVAAFAPQWCLFWGDGVRTNQFYIWLPYLRRSRNRFAIMCSANATAEVVRAIVADLPNCAIVEPYVDARSWLRESPGFRGFLYVVTNRENFSVINGFRRAMHIWVGHGESGKAANAFRTASIYDSVFMADYGAIQRFPRAIRRWVGQGACAIGAPVVEDAVKDPWTRPRQIRTVLYAPTWEGKSDGVDYSSLPEVSPILAEAIPRFAEKGVKVIVRPHPGTGGRNPAHKALLAPLFDAGAVRRGEKAADFAEADLMISDVSGVLAEFLFTEKPTIMPVSPRLMGIVKGDMLDREYPWVDRWDIADDLVERVLAYQTDDPFRARRAAGARDKYRGHRSLEEAVRTFDLALTCAQWRKTRVPVRRVFEAKRLLARVRRSRGGRAHPQP